MQREQLIKRIRYGIIIIVVLLIAVYSIYEAQRIIQGPQMIVLTPQDGATVNQSLIDITGSVQNINRLKLNDRDIFQDEQGNFSEKLLLSYGYNSIKLEGWDKFGRSTTKVMQMIYK
ncbi:MAG: hypothetical protein WAV11_00005 [Minisyncoccia bacterium]